MKILHVMWGLRYGGAESMLADILNYQVSFCQVELLVINDVVDEPLLAHFDPRVKIKKIGRPSGSYNPWYFAKLNMEILSSNADIIHFQQDGLIPYVLIRKLKNNLCLTIHSVEMDVPCIRKYNYLFTVSPVVQDKLINEYGMDSKLIMNGIDIQAFRKKEKHFNPGEKIKIVQIGRLVHPIKGQHILLQALRQLIDKYHFENFQVDIIGDGPSENYLKSMSTDLQLDSFVSFKGPQSKNYIQEHLADYDLLVQPSIYEGFGLTVVEAMAANISVLVADVDGLKMLAQNGKTAFVFKPEDVNSCADMIYKIANSSEEERTMKMGNATDYIQANFEISKVAQSYLDHYQVIINKMKGIA